MWFPWNTLYWIPTFRWTNLCRKGGIDHEIYLRNDWIVRLCTHPTQSIAVLVIMANPSFPNEYNLRTVADSSSKPCFVCHKASTKVLITADNKVGHLSSSIHKINSKQWSQVRISWMANATGLLLYLSFTPTRSWLCLSRNRWEGRSREKEARTACQGEGSYHQGVWGEDEEEGKGCEKGRRSY